MSRKRLVLVDDEDGQRSLLKGYLVKHGFEVQDYPSGEAALDGYPRFMAPVALVDMKMPGMSGLELLSCLREINPFVQVIILTAYGSVDTAVTAMKAGAFDFLTKPVDDLNELLLKLSKAVEQNRLVVDHKVLTDRLAEVFPQSEIVGESPAMVRVKELISLVAPGDATVLISGPSGTGKELVARAVHALSPRANERLVSINCAAFPETLLESELFGHEKGAFTGADRTKQGRFELAQGGTLFLDEVGEMPLTMQVKLLRVLEDRRIQRLGATHEIELDIRLLAATNRDLVVMVDEGRFRQDLYYRLNVVEIALPPLKDRGADILLLARQFLDRCVRKIGKSLDGITPEAARLLLGYGWPGNVRELQNAIDRAVILCRSNMIDAADLSNLAPKSDDAAGGRLAPLSQIEKEHIAFCLGQLDWNLGRCADVLGIHRNTLRAKIREYALSRD